MIWYCSRNFAIISNMRLNVRVIPRSSKNEIIELSDGSIKAKLTAPPVEGEANKKLIELIAKKFNTAKSRVQIVRGARGKNKIIDLL